MGSQRHDQERGMRLPENNRLKFKDNIRKNPKQSGRKNVDRIQQILNSSLKGKGYFASS